MADTENYTYSNIPTVESYLKRVSLFLENGNWREADLYCEKVLDINPKNAQAYLGKLLAELRLKNKEDLKNCTRPFESNTNYQRSVRFGDEALSAELTEYMEQSKLLHIQKAKKKAKRNKMIAIIAAITALVVIAVIVYITAIRPAIRYNYAVSLMNDADSSMNVCLYQDAIAIFDSLDGYKDSNEKIAVCKYNSAVLHMVEHNSTHDAEIFFKSIRNDTLAGWETISAGEFHTVGIKDGGTVVAIGRNYEGQCNVADWTDIVAVSAGCEHTVGLRADGTAVATEYAGRKESYRNQCDVSGWTDIVAISAGTFHTVGLKADGTVVATGWNRDGQCDVSDWRDIIAITAGDDHTIGLMSNGTVVIAGDRGFGQNNISDWTDIVMISKVGIHTAGLRTDGSVVADGWNEDGQCDVSQWADIVMISAGGYHTVGLTSNGTVVAVGKNDYGQCDVDGWTNMKLPTTKSN